METETAAPCDQLSGLPRDLLVEVFARLPELDAAVAVGRVCRPWREAASAARAAHRSPGAAARSLPPLPLW